MKKLMMFLVFFITLAYGDVSVKQVELAMQQNNIDLTEKLSKEAVIEHPNSAKAHYFLGQVFYNRNNNVEALKEFNKAKDLDPKLSFTKDKDKFNFYIKQSSPPNIDPKLNSTKETPKTVPVNKVEESGFFVSNFKNTLIFGLIAGFLVGFILFFKRLIFKEKPFSLNEEYDLNNFNDFEVDKKKNTKVKENEKSINPSKLKSGYVSSLCSRRSVPSQDFIKDSNDSSNSFVDGMIVSGIANSLFDNISSGSSENNFSSSSSISDSDSSSNNTWDTSGSTDWGGGSSSSGDSW